MTGNDFTTAVEVVIALLLLIQLGRFALQACAQRPRTALLLGSALLGSLANPPERLRALATAAGASATSTSTVQHLIRLGEPLGPRVADEDMVANYLMHRAEYQRDVASAEARMLQIFEG